MKIFRSALLGMLLAGGLVSGAYAHGPRVGVSVQFGYPGYNMAPPVYYAPPPVVYVPPPPLVYAPQPYVVPPYGYADYYYGYDRDPRHGWHRHGHGRHHRH